MKVNTTRLNNYLKRIHATACPLCGNAHWEIVDTVFQTIEFDRHGIILNGAAYPIVPLTCANCGNTYFINALVAGLIDAEPKTTECQTASNSNTKDSGDSNGK